MIVYSEKGVKLDRINIKWVAYGEVRELSLILGHFMLANLNILDPQPVIPPRPDSIYADPGSGSTFTFIGVPPIFNLVWYHKPNDEIFDQEISTSDLSDRPPTHPDGNRFKVSHLLGDPFYPLLPYSDHVITVFLLYLKAFRNLRTMLSAHPRMLEKGLG